MTFCLGIKTQEGLVALADTRLTSGTQTDIAKKVTLHRHAGREVFVMTSGLRSVRDKTLTYFDEELVRGEHSLDRLYQLVNLYAAQLRKVAEEDREALGRSGLRIDLHTLIGGRFEQDAEHALYMVYPEGNWVEVNKMTPYYIIGESGYGKPILDRTLRHTDSLSKAVKVGFLAFDATRTSASDVAYPIDMVTYRADSGLMHEHRLTEDEGRPLSQWWNQHIRDLVDATPDDLVNALCVHALG